MKLGFTAFGGPAMVAYIMKEVVERRHWVDEGIFARGVAICNSIPGATAMQMAAYSGLRARGAAGALAAYLGFGLPAFLLMLILTGIYLRAGEAGPVLAAFTGLKLVVVAIVANAAISFGRSIVKRWQDAVFALGSGLYIFWAGGPVEAILASALLGLLLYGGAGEVLGHGGAPGDEDSARWGVALGCIFVGAVALLSLIDGYLGRLALLMAKIDLFAFGGGYASLPLMLHEVVRARHWLDQKTFMDGIALGQVTPGPIVITATFVGYLKGGIAGAVVATVGILTPSFVVLLLTVPYFDRFHSRPLFKKALEGILASFVGLLAAVALKFAWAIQWSLLKAAISGAALAALMAGIDILWVVLGTGAVSLLLF